MNDNEILQAILNKLDSLDARLDKIDARLDNLKGDMIETRISILALSEPIKLTIPRDIHALSDTVQNIKESIQNHFSDSH